MTLLSCSNCGTPICPECMTSAAVGIRCPDCAGGQPVVRARGGAWGGHATTATVVLVAVTVIVFLAQVLQGSPLGSGASGSVVERGALWGPLVAHGEWWRLVTAGFIHAGLIHIAFNMYALWWLGNILEARIGSLKMVLIYFSALLWGSAGALVVDAIKGTPSLTVGASGGVFGLMAALLVMERSQGVGLLQSPIGVMLLLNLGITFALPGISIGGHIGGILGGALATLALSCFGRATLAYRKLTFASALPTLGVIAGAVVLAIGVA